MMATNTPNMNMNATATEAVRTAAAQATSYWETYTGAWNKVFDATQRLNTAMIEASFRMPLYGLNVWRQALEETAKPDMAGAFTRPTNVARIALSETAALQADARKIADEVANTVKVGQDAAIDLAQANHRLMQSSLNANRNGASA